MKVCSTCHQSKDLSSFLKRKTAKDGLTGYCRSCHNLRNALWRVKNPEAHKAIVTRQNIKRKPYRAFKKNACEACSFIALDSCQLHVDHIDGNHLNNDINNLQTLCANCHALKSKLNGDVGRQPKLRLLERVV